MLSSSPPLVHALAQIVFPTPLRLEGGPDQLRDALYPAGYVRFDQRQTQELVFVLGQEPAMQPQTRTHWVYADPACAFVFVLTENSLVLHTTAYTNHEEFFVRMREGVAAVTAALDVACIDRVGLRYTNLIQFDAHDPVGDWIAAELLGFPFQGTGIQTKGRNFGTNTMALTEVGNLAVRSAVVAPGHFLPPDLNAENVKRPTNVLPNLPGVIVDIDHFTVFAERGVNPLHPSADEVVQWLTRLHDDVRRAYEASFTPEALARWSGVNPNPL
jgi:uncharacterized protein (TIGR04255 family)